MKRFDFDTDSSFRELGLINPYWGKFYNFWSLVWSWDQPERTMKNIFSSKRLDFQVYYENVEIKLSVA